MFFFLLNLVIFFKKELKLLKFVFTTHLNAFDSIVHLIFKIMDFDDVTWTKVIHFYVVKNMNA
jgi:hypothetical protein